MKGTIKPKIALIADVEGWAFHNYAKQIKNYLGIKYDFKIFFHGKYNNNLELFKELQGFDLVHFFWRGALFNLLNETHSSTDKDEIFNRIEATKSFFSQSKITTSIYDHLFLNENEIQDYSILFNFLSDGYTTCSSKLYSIYSDIEIYPSPSCVVENGIDLQLFHPSRKRSFTLGEELIVGWAGNSKWGNDGIDHKGLETIIKPAIQELKEEGFKIRGYFADRQSKWIAHDEMNDYYNSIDVYICASDFEGSPDPILESMACGLPIISTDVGIVREVFGRRQKKYILSKRGIPELKLKIKEFINSPAIMKLISEENVAEIKKRSWDKQCLKWDNFFENIINLPNSKEKTRQDFLRKTYLETYLEAKLNKQLKNHKEEELNAKEQSLKHKNEELNSIRQQRNEIEAWNTELKEYLNKSQQRISELEKWTSELQEVWKKSQDRIEELEKYIEEIIKLKDDYSIQNQQLLKAKVELKENSEVLKQELLKHQNIIKEMEKSRFWKLRNYWMQVKEIKSSKQD